MSDTLSPAPSINVEALRLIDLFLPLTQSQTMIDANRVGDLLLDLRLLLAVG